MPTVSKPLVGLAATLLAAFLFSCKAILGKLVYAAYPLEVAQLLLMRMAVAAPFYMLIFIVQAIRFRQAKGRWPWHAFSLNEIFAVLALGLLGYYVSSFLDFWGLQFVSAGLERIILFSYPSMVVLFGFLFYGKAISAWQGFALVLSYLGVAIAFVGELKIQSSTNLFFGSSLIFCCAITFALYVLLSGRLIPKVGVGLFTSTAMLSATVGVAAHFFVQGGALADIAHLPPTVYRYMVLMGIFTTVVPSLLVSVGIKMIGSQNQAIASSVGPIITIVLAHYLLQEPVGVLQIVGMVLVILGVLLIGKQVKREAAMAATLPPPAA